MKRFLVCLLIIAALLFAVVACNRDGQETEAPTGDEQNGTEQGEKNPDKGKETEPHEHSYGEWQVSKEPTCDKVGLKYAECACGDKKTEQIAKIEHTLVSKAAKDPTCTAVGWDAYDACSKCSYSTYVEKAMLEHSYKDGNCSVCGHLYTSKGLDFVSNGDGTCYVSGVGSCSDINIVIPEKSPDGDAVTGIANGAFKNNSSITEVTILDSVKTIGESAFHNCSMLKSVTVGNGVTAIGDNAFYNCITLANVSLPDSITSIGKYAFDACHENLGEVYQGVLYIGKWAVKCDASVNSVVIKVGTLGIADNAFENLYNISSVNLADSVKYIGNYSFYNCYGLKTANVGNGIVTVGDHAFALCNKLVDIALPQTVTTIGSRAFYECKALSTATMTNNVISIGSGAFEGCSALVDFELSNGISVIEDKTFYGCSKLPGVTICDKVERIGKSAFEGCSALANVTIPDSVTEICNRAFLGCSSFTSVNIPAGITSVGEAAFGNCPNVENISIAEGNSVYYSKSNCLIEIETKTIIAGCKNSVIPEDKDEEGNYKVTVIGNYAFYGCSGLAEIKFSECITAINDFAFYGCTGLTSLEIPGTITSIGHSSFYGCSGITTATIHKGITQIGANAFYSCSKLTSITFEGYYSEWEAIAKGSDWKKKMPDFKVQCCEYIKDYKNNG